MTTETTLRIEQITIEGPHGPIDARTYEGAERCGAALLWLHGGGWVFGDLDMPEADFVARTIAAGGVPVVSADYHKALGGIRHPVLSDDALAAWLWTSDRFAGEQISIGGASAGANLAAGVAKRARDGAGPTPASVVLAYPLLHAELPAFSDDLEAALQIKPPHLVSFSREDIIGFTSNVSGDEVPSDDPYAWPANGDLAGMAPTLIVNAEYDSIRASAELYGEALRAAGVRVAVEMEPGTGHGHLNGSDAASRHSIELMTDWLRETGTTT